MDGLATILKSTDGGLNWTRQTGGLTSDVDHLLGISAADADTAWAVGSGPASDDGYIVLHTANGGATWEEQPGLVGTHDANEVYAVDTQTVWVAADASIGWSTDGGVSWDSYSGAGWPVSDITAVSSQEAWAVSGGWAPSISHTADGGISWHNLTQLDGEDLPGMMTISFATQPIPEPSTLALLSLGGLLLMLFGLRRRK